MRIWLGRCTGEASCRQLITFRVLLALLLASLLNVDVHAQVPGETAVRTVLSGGGPPADEMWDVARWRDGLLALYQERDFAPLWFTGSRLTPAGDSLLEELSNAHDRGLEPADYDADRLAAYVAELERTTAGPEAVALVDVMLSVAAARMAADLHAGRVAPRDVGHDLDVPHVRTDVRTAVASLAAASDVAAALDDLEPSLSHYDLLKNSLASYRRLAMNPELTHLPILDRPVIKAGERYSGAAALRRLLQALGDMQTPSHDSPVEAGARTAGEAGSDHLDPPTIAALKRFQERHGLKVDGILGRATWAELTTPLALRVRQIELSLERARWLPPKLDTPPIIVNIPQFELFAFRTVEDRAESILRMKVIVGTEFPRNNTPVFAGDLRYVVLRPYWDVPYSILVRELLPSIRKDPNWIERNGYEIVRGQMDRSPVVPATPENVELLARGSLRLRQKPGPNNALGLVKFMLPNRHNVYLHDTPAQSLFSEARRAYSHGCVRVADPLTFAEHVLRDLPEWTREGILAGMRGNETVRIDLPRPIRVFMIYGTALATEDGRTLFFPDIYQHDVRLDAALRARRPLAAASS